ncbi:hypothetical protein LTR62_001650 [Meristemomyces frigidus]|uniref:Transcription initiation factor IIF subunit alpha n=1 Tax=Meristemomyces frigidus TaxID=1508187 RepID=A0AAN7T7V7_9PEZI|nr:hypothetical protein LTR62_001650 [Meristemomyces frigidus]
MSAPSVNPITAKAPPMPRKKAPVSIFNPKKKPAARKPATSAVASGPAPVSGNQPVAAPPPPANATSVPATAPKEDEAPFGYRDYPIVITKSALMKGLHYHGFRMMNGTDAKGQQNKVDPSDEKQFTRPVRLYRRRPQDKPEAADLSDVASGVDDKDREAREIKRAERQAEREANQALIAPTGESSKRQIKKKPQKKVEDVYWDENNAKNQAKSKLRYEEARPWHLEDFDSKNRWVGSYQEPLSNKHVMLEVTQADNFNMVPVEKWYRMTRVDRVKLYDDATVQKMMDPKYRPPRWLLHGKDESEVAAIAKKHAIAAKREELAQRGQLPRKKNVDDDGPSIKQEEYRGDVDEIDFEYNDEFQDDDEGFLWGDANDDEAKDVEKRVRDERRQAGLPDADVKGADQEDWINEEKDQKNAEDDERKRQKKMRKQLKRKESRFEYESDEDGNIYMSSSDSENSEEEREREAEEAKKREAETAAGEKSGTSSKGSNTPSAREEKKNMKREADVSDASGNEGSRKKVRLNGSGSGAGTSQLSPDAAKRILSGYGSGSETDNSRAHGPSSSQKGTGPSAKKLLLKNSPPGSPRDGTPSGSRAQSPARPAGEGFPTLEEIKAAIPPEGIHISKITQPFKVRVGSRSKEFIAMVKSLCIVRNGILIPLDVVRAQEEAERLRLEGEKRVGGQ